jgi:hypothetical protein
MLNDYPKAIISGTEETAEQIKAKLNAQAANEKYFSYFHIHDVPIIENSDKINWSPGDN